MSRERTGVPGGFGCETMRELADILMWIRFVSHLRIPFSWCSECGMIHAAHQSHPLLDASPKQQAIARSGWVRKQVDSL